MSMARKKKELEKQKVMTSKMEIELKIEERKEEILRLEEHIKVQDSRISELEAELEEMV